VQRRVGDIAELALKEEGITMRMQNRLIVAAVAGSLFAVSSHASTAWFGISPPPSLSDPHRPVIDVSGTTVPAAKVPAGEEGFEQLRGERIYRDVAAIVDFSKQSSKEGNKVWGRVTGFPSAKATIEWSAQQFRAAGLKQVEVQEYAAGADTAMWWATDWEAKVLADASYGAGTQDIVLKTAVPTSGSMMPAPITAPLVFVGPITDEKLPDVDVKGKIAVQHLKPARGAFSERTRTVDRAKGLTERGAVAILNVVEQTGNMHTRDFGNCGAPCFNIGTADGAFLEAAIARAAAAKAPPVRVQLKLSAQRLTGLKGHNAIGVIPGSSEENIIVNAHADGWYDAAGDNADGLAVLMALARHFAVPAHKPARTLVFVASGGHHSTGLNGPANVVKMNEALVKNAVLVVNLEHIAQYEIVAGEWKLSGKEQPMNFGVDNSAPFLLDLGKRAMERYGFNLNPTFTTSVSGDLGGYAPLGVARLQAIHSGPMYHASGDVLETISVPGLERAARFYAYLISEAAKAPRASINPAKSSSGAASASALATP
jgi:hypothetical protein